MWRKTPDARPPLTASEGAPPGEATSADRPPAEGTRPRGEGSRLAPSLTLKGEITGQSDLLLDCAVEGSVRLSGACLTVGPNGRVEGDLAAREVVIEGQVRGTVEARERVQLRRTAVVLGNIASPRLMIEEGAILRGRVEMAAPGEARVVGRARDEAMRPVVLPAGN
jgi:cytoskeletal protein CcmA (bactofilin family)